MQDLAPSRLAMPMLELDHLMAMLEEADASVEGLATILVQAQAFMAGWPAQYKERWTRDLLNWARSVHQDLSMLYLEGEHLSGIFLEKKMITQILGLVWARGVGYSAKTDVQIEILCRLHRPLNWEDVAQAILIEAGCAKDRFRLMAGETLYLDWPKSSELDRAA